MLQNPRNPARDDDDPGLGSNVLSRRARLILPNGNFNIRRTGIKWWRRTTPYQWLAQISWLHFTCLAISAYLVVNTAFAIGYLAIGVQHLEGVIPGTGWHDLESAWFFSAQTLTTVGYGHISPTGSLTSATAAAEALLGLLGFGVWTGLLFSRFSRARAQILFSSQAIVAPYRDGRAWMVRAVASHDHPLLDAEAYVLFSWVDESPNGSVRRYQDLSMERSTVRFFPMNWTLVHAIDAQSPLHRCRDELEAVDAEIMVLIRAHDETYGQTVHARSSWKAADIVFGARFVPMLSSAPDGATLIDLSLLGRSEAAELPDQLLPCRDPRTSAAARQ